MAARSGRVRLVLDGPPPTRPQALAFAVAEGLRTRGRAAVVVDAEDYLRPASLRLEHGRTDPDAFLDDRLDVGGLRREVLAPAAPEGSGRVLPRLWDAPRRPKPTATRTSRCPPTASWCSPAACCWGCGLPVDLAVHLRMSPAALARRLPGDEAWTLPRVRPLRQQSTRPPTGPRTCWCWPTTRTGLRCGAAESATSRGKKMEQRVGEEGVEPSRPFGHTDLNRARLPFRHSPG